MNNRCTYKKLENAAIGQWSEMKERLNVNSLFCALVTLYENEQNIDSEIYWTIQSTFNQSRPDSLIRN